MGYFIKTFKPDIINGAVGSVIRSNKIDLAFAADDILFDWQPVEIPHNTHSIEDCFIHMFGEDGGSQTGDALTLLIAKSNNGVAPTSLGSVNAAVTGCFELPDILMGVVKMSDKSDYAFGSLYNFNDADQTAPIIIEPENNNLGSTRQNDRLTTIYVAALAEGNFNFSTGVLSNAGVSDDSATSIVTNTVDPRQAFRPGDVVYIHDVNTAIGTVSSLTNNDIVLTANNVGAIASSDEFMNATPIKVSLKFARARI
jgi:hypothetical protein